jgi:branched-chain amino acid transport system substrate-binding protein
LTNRSSRKDHGSVKTTAAVLVVLLAGLAAACGDDNESVEPVAATSCGGVLYEGEGKPDAIVVADNPLRGVHAAATKEVVDAIEHVLRQRDFRAGGFRVGFQSCDYTVGGELDAGQCRRNAQAYVETSAVVGVIGPYNSGCAEIQIPILSRTAAGPLAMVSATNTDEGLTRGPYALPLYPDGVRNYARVVTHDQAQGIAAAHLARRSGARRAAVLAMRGLEERYVGQLSESFRAATRALGIESKSYDWQLEESYVDLAASIAAARPDVVYLVGLPEHNAKTLIGDLRAALGQVPLITPDSFAADEMALDLGPIGDGLLTTVPGIPHSALPPAGKTFLREFGETSAAPGQPGAPEAAQATDVLLDAIARSDGTRASVVDELFTTKVGNGILGSFSFDRLGDIDPAPVGVYRYEGGKLVVDSLVRAPLGSAD